MFVIKEKQNAIGFIRNKDKKKKKIKLRTRTRTEIIKNLNSRI